MNNKKITNDSRQLIYIWYFNFAVFFAIFITRKFSFLSALIIILALSAIGLYILKIKGSQQASSLEKESVSKKEKSILRVAAIQRGYVTAVDITIATELTLDEAKEILDLMKSRGLCSLRVADNGSYVYQFESLISYEEKKNSERI